jgi:hypothetical protein
MISLNVSLGLGKYVLHELAGQPHNQLNSEGLMIPFFLRRVLQGCLSSLSRSHTRTRSTQLRSIVIYILCQYHVVAQRLQLIFQHYRFPKTYPTNAHPLFTIQQPIKGISDDCATRLSNFIQAEARQSRGTEIVFQVSEFLCG